MKRKLGIVLSLSLAVMLGGIFSTGFLAEGSASKPTAISSVSTISERTLSVVGEAEVVATPDIAYVNLGVRTEAKDSKTAQSENDKKMNDIMAQLEKLGINKKDIKTSNYNLYPNYIYDRETQKSIITGYVADNAVTVKINDIDKLGTVLDTVVSKGSNVINGINFDISNREDLYQKALQEAVKKTKSKAEAMADALGVKTVSIKHIEEQGSVNRVMRNYAVAESALMNDGSSSSASISAGEIKIKANVNAIYNY